MPAMIEHSQELELQIEQQHQTVLALRGKLEQNKMKTELTL